jgi:hypothetical protein
LPPRPFPNESARRNGTAISPDKFRALVASIHATTPPKLSMPLEEFLRLSTAERRAIPPKERVHLYAELMVQNLRHNTAPRDGDEESAKLEAWAAIHLAKWPGWPREWRR